MPLVLEQQEGPVGGGLGRGERLELVEEVQPPAVGLPSQVQGGRDDGGEEPRIVGETGSGVEVGGAGGDGRYRDREWN